MKKIHVRCNNAGGNKAPPASTEELDLLTSGKGRNVEFKISRLEDKYKYQIPCRLSDLLSIASFVYAADTRITRGGEKDVFADCWNRSFLFTVPVYDLSFWSDSDVEKMLCETLTFLTGDEFKFDFVVNSMAQNTQYIIGLNEVGPLHLADVVVPFSGGVDSLAAVIEAVHEEKYPVLVSHLSTSKLAARQDELVRLLKDYFKPKTFPHFSLRINNCGPKRPTEYTQRSRAFLYASLGAVIGALIDVEEIRLCDNGVVSINLPQSAQNIGTTLSRSTHPVFLYHMQELIRKITGMPDLLIKNKLMNKTKKEVMETIKASGHPELLQETLSCGHTWQSTRMTPHCGVCFQCIDRRFASRAAGLDNHDLADHYKKDIFVDSLSEGYERTYLENYVRFASELEKMSDPDIFSLKFPEIDQAIRPDDTNIDKRIAELWALFQRHQESVNSVLDDLIRSNASDIRRGIVKKGTLLDMIRTRIVSIDMTERYVHSLSELICEGLPPAFQTVKAEDEKHVQDIGKALLKTAREKLHRESPQVPFATISVKSDFSKVQDRGTGLFVEFKYVRARNRLNGVTKEMAACVTTYGDQGVTILFIVYDPNRAIDDDEQFKKQFEKHEGVWVGISR